MVRLLAIDSVDTSEVVFNDSANQGLVFVWDYPQVCVKTFVIFIPFN